MSSPEPRSSPLTPAEQTRIRRERRQAKVRESAGSRLDRITSTQGSTFRTESTSTTTTTTTTAISSSPPTTSDDPPEIDISRHRPVPVANKAEELQQAALIEQMFGGMPPPSSTEGGLPGMAGMENDPMMKLLAQMSGGGVPRLRGMGGMGGGVQDISPSSVQHDWVWRLVHGLASMALALFVVFGTDFDGSEEARMKSSEQEQRPLFWYFATMELVLQSTRFLLEKGRPPQGSILSTIGSFLPPPFGGYVTTLARYTAFVSVIIQDAGVVIFFLGLAAWWNSS